MPADLFPDIDFGEALQATLVLSFEAQDVVHKGCPVKLDTHISEEIGTASEAGYNDKAIGVFLKDAAAGEMVPVLIIGIVKVQANGDIPVGSAVKASVNRRIQSALSFVRIPTGGITVTSTSAQPTMTVESGLAFGFALQTFTDLDDGLIAIGMGMP